VQVSSRTGHVSAKSTIGMQPSFGAFGIPSSIFSPYQGLAILLPQALPTCVPRPEVWHDKQFSPYRGLAILLPQALPTCGPRPELLACQAVHPVLRVRAWPLLCRKHYQRATYNQKLWQARKITLVLC
jgi:hypothetical protein